MIEQTCPWELSRRLVRLGFSSDSFYRWVHPYQSSICIEDKSRYILVDRISALKRNGFPAYSISEILQNLPEEYILGRMGDEWYCKSFSEGWDATIYYLYPILACAYAAIHMLEQKGCAEEAEEK